MMTLDQQVQLHREVVDTELDGGETVLLHLDNKTYYSLNMTGTRIWQGLKRGLTLQEIGQGLQAEFEVDREMATCSVLALVNELHQQRLVHVLEP